MIQHLIIFDVDGTLVDSQAHIMGAVTAAFESCGLPVPPRARVLSQIGRSLDLLMAEIAGAEAAPALADAYRRSFADQRRSETASPLYPGTVEMLDELAGRDDVVLAVATGKSRRGLDRLIETHDWHGMFASLQTADSHPSKPHPAMLHTVLDETGIAPDRAVMVGDTSFDIDMGRVAGLATIAVPWGYHDATQLNADAVIHDWTDLPTTITRLMETRA